MFVYRYVLFRTNHKIDTAMKNKSSHMISRRVGESIHFHAIEHRDTMENNQVVPAYDDKLLLSDRRSSINPILTLLKLYIHTLIPRQMSYVVQTFSDRYSWMKILDFDSHVA